MRRDVLDVAANGEESSRLPMRTALAWALLALTLVAGFLAAYTYAEEGLTPGVQSAAILMTAYPTLSGIAGWWYGRTRQLQARLDALQEDRKEGS